MTTTIQPARSVPVSTARHAESAEKRYATQTRRRRVSQLTLTISMWVFVAIPLAFWLATGNFGTMTSAGMICTELGVITGLVGTALCMEMLILTARVPWIDQVVGQDRAVATHRNLGAYTIIALLLHGVLLITGSSLAGKTNWFSELSGMLAVPDLLLGIIGFLLLGLVGISSYQVAKRALGHEAWHAIHLLTYIAVGISLPHQFSMGVFAASGLARWYWLVVWMLVGFLILTYRLFVPLIETLTQQLRVTAVYPAGPDAVNIEVSGPRVADMKVGAGSYFHWRFLDRTNWWHQHPFSVSAAPLPHTLRITVRNLGKGSASLQHVQVGTRVAIAGPYGIFSDAARTTTAGVVIMGAGIGIAPIRALLEDTDIQPGRATVILRASRPEELYLVEEIRDLCRAKGAALHIAVGPRARSGTSWLPERWADATLPDLAPHAKESDLYICGPQQWTDAVIKDAISFGVSRDRIHDERFAW